MCTEKSGSIRSGTLLIRWATGSLSRTLIDEVGLLGGFVRPCYSVVCNRHEGTLESRGVTPFILNLGTRWRRALFVTPRPIYSSEETPRYPLSRKRPHNRSGHWRIDKYPVFKTIYSEAALCDISSVLLFLPLSSDHMFSVLLSLLQLRNSVSQKENILIRETVTTSEAK